METPDHWPGLVILPKHKITVDFKIKDLYNA